MILLTYAAISVMSGIHAALLGAYKDSPYEGFRAQKVIRSVAISLVLGTAIAGLTLSYGLHLNYGMYFLYVLALERIITEFHKEFIRIESQDKYTIPQQ